MVPLAGVRHLGRMHRGQHTDIFLVFPDQGKQPFVGGAVTNITSLELHGGQVLGHVLTIFSDRPDDVRLLAVQFQVQVGATEPVVQVDGVPFAKETVLS